MPPTGRGENIFQQLSCFQETTAHTRDVTKRHRSTQTAKKKNYKKIKNCCEQTSFDTRNPTPVQKTIHLSKENECHEDHMAEVILGAGGAARGCVGIAPTHRFTEVSAVPHGPALAREPLTGVNSLSKAHQQKGTLDTSGALK